MIDEGLPTGCRSNLLWEGIEYRALQVPRWFAVLNPVQEQGDIAQISLKRLGLWIFLDQRSECRTLCRSVGTIDLPMDELDLVLVQHGLPYSFAKHVPQPLPCREEARLHGSDGDLQHVGNLLIRKGHEMLENHHGTIVGLQAHQSLSDPVL